MSYIIGGGGGGGGLTEAEVNTLIGRGAANGTAALDVNSNLEVPNSTVTFNKTPTNILFYSGSEQAMKVVRGGANTYDARIIRGGTERKLLDTLDRNRESSAGVAAIYNPCKTIFNEHRPVCTKEYHFVGKYLDGADNPDVWFPIPGAGGGTVTYSTRYLTLTSGTGAANSASRCVIDQTKFPINGNFAEVTCKIGASVTGAGGTGRLIAVGFQPAFSSAYTSLMDRAIFIRGADGAWMVGGKESSVTLSSLPLGRNLLSGDICTVRLDRQEGSSNIDIARFYVNGQKQYETLNIPEVDCYAGIGAFADANTTTATSIAIDYFGVRYVP